MSFVPSYPLANHLIHSCGGNAEAQELIAAINSGGAGSGTVTTVSIVTANGISGSVANPTTTPAITIALGDITPTSVTSSGAISGSNFSGSSSGTNTGDQTTLAVTDDNSTNATVYPVWVTANSGSLPLKVSSTKLSFNPSTGDMAFGGNIAVSGATPLPQNSILVQPVVSLSSNSYVGLNCIPIAAIQGSNELIALTGTSQSVVATPNSQTGQIIGCVGGMQHVGTGTVVLGVGFNARIDNVNGGLLATAAGIIVSSATNSDGGSIGTMYGLFIDTQNAASTNYAIFTNGSAQSQFGGAVNVSGNITGNNLSGTNTGDQTITLTGDVSGSGTGSFSATIGANVVTYAKMQKESATTLLGNPTGSLANISEITLGSGLSFSGSVINTTNSGVVTSVGLSMPGQFTVTNSPVTSTGTLTATLPSPMILANGSQAFTANQSLGSNKLVNVLDPTSPQDAATKNYVDTQIALQPVKQECQAATVAALAASTYNNGSSGVGATLTLTVAAVLILDGYTPFLNDRLLIKNQADPTENGIYSLTTVGVALGAQAVLTRTLDFDQPSDGINGAFVFVQNGTINASTGWLCNTFGTITFGHGGTAINWVEDTGSGTYTGTLPISVSASNVISVGLGDGVSAPGSVLNSGWTTSQPINTFEILANGTEVIYEDPLVIANGNVMILDASALLDLRVYNTPFIDGRPGSQVTVPDNCTWSPTGVLILDAGILVEIAGPASFDTAGGLLNIL